MKQDQSFDERESLQLITTMIHKARNVHHDTGRSSILWGVVIALCSFVKLSELHFGYRLPFDIFLLSFAAIIPQIIISVKEKREQKVRSYDDRFINFLWMGFGVSIFLLVLIINMSYAAWVPIKADMKAVGLEATGFPMNEFICSLFLILYGLPTFITGATCKFKPMLWGGLFCWCASILAVFTTVKVDLFLTGIAAIFAWLIPGIIAERAYRKAKRLEAIHV